MTTMNIHEVLNHLPHRFPFLLVDRVLDIDKGKSLKALKNVTINEPFFCGHFPGQPVMPGVLIIEALAQAACVLAFSTTGADPKDGDIYLFAAADKVRFKRVVEPGDQLILDINVLKVRGKGDILKVEAIASVDGEVACSAELLSVRKGKDSDT